MFTAWVAVFPASMVSVRKKIDALAAYCDPVEMSIMKTIKRAMDPNNILNPGKLIRA